MTDNVNDISVKDMNGNDVQLSGCSRKVLLIVNVASECGFTPQYKGLQEIYDKYKARGFEVLGFPCNDFGAQEPGNNDQIKRFASSKYGVTFKLFDKIKILGKDKSPLYERLTNNPVTTKGDVRWNFEKFLISKNGKIVKRFLSNVTPTSDEVMTSIEMELRK